VREAIRLRRREGLATSAAAPRRGGDMSARDLRELFEIRASLFELVARRVMAERPPELIAVLRAGVAKLEQLAQVPEGSDAYVETGYRLMMITTRFCGNERLQRMMSSWPCRRCATASRAWPRSSAARNRQAWRAAQQALESGDLEALTQLTRLRIQARATRPRASSTTATAWSEQTQGNSAEAGRATRS
jgi:DNA-binding GntR family transcriptional regulator